MSWFASTTFLVITFYPAIISQTKIYEEWIHGNKLCEIVETIFKKYIEDKYVLET